MNLRLHVALLSLLMCAFVQAKGQETSAFADTKLYDAVLGNLFQHPVQPGLPEVQLRYTYCNVGEMQIVVHKLKNSDFQLDVWYLPPGAPSIWNQLAELAKSNPALTADAAAASMKMSRKTVTAPSSSGLAKLLDKTSLLSIPLLNQNTITLDGMAYGITVRSTTEDMNLTLQGPQHSDESSSELIRWMGQVRSSVEAEFKTAPRSGH